MINHFNVCFMFLTDKYLGVLEHKSILHVSEFILHRNLQENDSTYPFIMDPTYIPPSPPLLLCPTIEIPKKFTVSMFNVTVMMFSDIVESVILEYELVRDIA